MQSNKAYRNKKLLDAAKDRPCVLCGSVGTTVSAHANRVALGKGTGIKAPDYYVVYVCQKHHDQIDGRRTLDPGYESPWEMWTLAFLRTVAIWFREGIVTC